MTLINMGMLSFKTQPDLNTSRLAERYHADSANEN